MKKTISMLILALGIAHAGQPLASETGTDPARALGDWRLGVEASIAATGAEALSSMKKELLRQVKREQGDRLARLADELPAPGNRLPGGPRLAAE